MQFSLANILFKLTAKHDSRSTKTLANPDPKGLLGAFSKLLAQTRIQANKEGFRNTPVSLGVKRLKMDLPKQVHSVIETGDKVKRKIDQSSVRVRIAPEPVKSVLQKLSSKAEKTVTQPVVKKLIPVLGLPIPGKISGQITTTSKVLSSLNISSGLKPELSDILEQTPGNLETVIKTQSSTPLSGLISSKPDLRKVEPPDIDLHKSLTTSLSISPDTKSIEPDMVEQKSLPGVTPERILQILPLSGRGTEIQNAKTTDNLIEQSPQKKSLGSVRTHILAGLPGKFIQSTSKPSGIQSTSQTRNAESRDYTGTKKSLEKPEPRAYDGIKTITKFTGKPVDPAKSHPLHSKVAAEKGMARQTVHRALDRMKPQESSRSSISSNANNTKTTAQVVNRPSNHESTKPSVSSDVLFGEIRIVGDDKSSSQPLKSHADGHSKAGIPDTIVLKESVRQPLAKTAGITVNRNIDPGKKIILENEKPVLTDKPLKTDTVSSSGKMPPLESAKRNSQSGHVHGKFENVTLEINKPVVNKPNVNRIAISQITVQPIVSEENTVVRNREPEVIKIPQDNVHRDDHSQGDLKQKQNKAQQTIQPRVADNAPQDQPQKAENTSGKQDTVLPQTSTPVADTAKPSEQPAKFQSAQKHTVPQAKPEQVDVADLVREVKLSVREGRSEIVMRLKPEILGKALVSLKQIGETLKVVFSIERLEARIAIEGEAAHIKENLQAAGFQNVQVEVKTHDGGSSKSEFSQQQDDSRRDSSSRQGREEAPPDRHHYRPGKRMFGYNTFDIAA